MGIRHFSLSLVLGIILTVQFITLKSLHHVHSMAFVSSALGSGTETVVSSMTNTGYRSTLFLRPLWYNETFGNLTNLTGTLQEAELFLPLRNETQPPPEEQWLITPVPFAEYNRSATIAVWKVHQKNITATQNVVIPRIIHKIFLSKSGGFLDFNHLPAGLKEAHASWKLMNPGYEMQYFDLATARSYLQTHFHPIFLRAFDCIEAFAGKTDLMRYAIVYREGGWYSDWKERCMVPNLLESMLAPRRDLAFFMDRGLRVSIQGEYISNAFFGATPRHPFWAAALRQTLINVQQQFYGDIATGNTGPGMLGIVRKELLKQNPPTDIFDFGKALGKYKWNYYYYPKPNKFQVIEHKCANCSAAGWGSHGNDYWKLHKAKTYYCQDAESLFSTSLG